ncbi:hypothetical protein GF327_06885 [Candidatus Woesearchaeota archaeon]|nr:hypothetical protein [Candidatus Woesearchaeota archaeon]
MEKKKKITAVILVIFTIGLIILMLLFKEPVYPQSPYFQNEPENWIEENHLSDSEQEMRVNLLKATQGYSIQTGNRQEYLINDSTYAFFSYGVYKGKEFFQVYAEPKKPNSQNLPPEDDVLMEISRELDPTDNIIQAYILAKENNKKFNFYIYVDKDWKNKLKYTKVIYGDDFSSPEKLKIRDFSYNEISTGIFLHEIKDSSEWYNMDPVVGGIIVGEINLVDIQNNNLNSTYVMLR